MTTDAGAAKVELLKAIYAEPAIVFDHLHPDFTLHSPGSSPIAGTFKGAEGMKAHFAHMDGLTGDTLKHDLTGTFLADENFGMVVHRLTARREGKTLDTWGFGLWRFADGLIIDHWESVGDQQHWDEFWS